MFIATIAMAVVLFPEKNQFMLHSGQKNMSDLNTDQLSLYNFGANQHRLPYLIFPVLSFSIATLQHLLNPS